jgi:3-oxoacyl-[acyl-carrier protein] reductase
MNIIQRIINKFRTKTIIKPIIVVKNPSNLLENQTAIVTGGSSGIGHAVAKRMVEAGAKVYIIGRNEQKLKQSAEEIGSNYLVVDINNIPAMEKTISQLSEKEDIDILVNSAGTHGYDKFGEVREETFDAVMSANVKALYFISQAIANQMIQKGIHGHILNVSSASSLKPSWTPYEISKRAVNGITQGMAHKLIEHGIVVNGIAPGPTATPMMKRSDNIQWDGNPSGRMQTVDEIASLALFMVSGQGDGIVGDTFFMTGGSGTICIDK